MRSMAAASVVILAQENFEDVVETGGVADAFFEDLETFVGGEFAAESGFAGASPAAIGADGIDFAVVRDVAEGLGELPRRAGVGGVALMENGEGRGEIRSGEIGIKRAQLERSEQTFIDEHARRERTEVKAGDERDSTRLRMR